MGAFPKQQNREYIIFCRGKFPLLFNKITINDLIYQV